MKPCREFAGMKDKDGYGRVVKRLGFRLYKDYRAHRVAYAEANGLAIEDLDGVIIRHSCDNRPCIEPTHLLAGTPADNNRDTRERGRNAKGDTHGVAKLCEADIPLIRARIAAGETHTAIAKDFDIARPQITRIANGNTWKHVK